MRLFFDDKYYKVYKDDFVIWYFSNLHKAIKLDYFYSEILEIILKSEQNKIYQDIDFSYICEDKNKVDDFIKFLTKRKIIFLDCTDLKRNYFINKYKKVTINNKRAYLHLTQKCNLNCSHCYNKHNLNKKVDELTTEQWIEAVNILVFLGYIDITITGGEPFLRKDITDIINNIKNKVNKITILTNGTLLNSNQAKQTIDYADEIIISLDSLNESINNQNREFSDRYKILENIVSQDKRHKITIRSVVSKLNVREIRELQQYFSELGYKFITINLLPNNIKETNQFCSTFFLQDFELKSNLHYLTKCGAGVSVISIDSNGDVYPCQTLMQKKLKVGNIFDDKSIEILIDKFSNEIIDITNIEECKECIFKYICGGGCRAINYNLYGSLNCKNKFLCNTYKERARRYIYSLFE